jgi:hypothetical protein
MMRMTIRETRKAPLASWRLVSGACACSTWSGINRTQVEVGTRGRGPLPEVETIQVHHLRPGRHEIVQELLLRIRASIHLS